MAIYAKSKDRLRELGTVWRESKPGAVEMWDEYLKLRGKHKKDDAAVEAALRKWLDELPEKHSAKKLRRYLHIDENGPWRDRDISWPGGGGPRYNVVHPKTKKPCQVPERGWGFSSADEMQRQIDLNLVVFREDHTKPPFRKAHLHPIAAETEDNDDIETDDEGDTDEVGVQVMPSVIYKQSQPAVRYLRNLLGAKVFENPKDYEVLARLFRYLTEADDIILDSFAGSGSTAQGVLEANKSDNQQRRFVLVQQKYDSKANEKEEFNICQKVTIERVKRALKKEKYVGQFTVANVGEPLFNQYGLFNKKLPKWDDLAKYIFYTETSRQIDAAKMKPESGFVGSQEGAGGTSYYLFYTPDAKKSLPMSHDQLNAILKKDKNRNWVIYCEKIWVQPDELRKFERENNKKIRAMQIPFQLR